MVLKDGPSPARLEAQPPYDVAAEEAVIAALLLDAEQCAEEGVFESLLPGDFFREHNGWVFQAARDIHDRRELVTPITLAHELTRGGVTWEPEEGWITYLTELWGHYFTAIGVSAHARIVAADSYYRRLISAAGQIAQLAYEGGPDYQRVQLRADDLMTGVRLPGNVIQASNRFRGGVSLEYTEVGQ